MEKSEIVDMDKLAIAMANMKFAHPQGKRAREYALDPEEFESEESESSESDSFEVKTEPVTPQIQGQPQPRLEFVETGAFLERQDAKIGDELMRALQPKGRFCGRALSGRKNAGKRCQRAVYKYGMCKTHWKLWKSKNPQLKYPGHY